MRLQRANQRRGIILLVVLALLTLFAIVGITFVLYSDSEAAAARIAREAESQQRADVDPEQALAFFLGQLIYDVNDNDVSGVGSANGATGGVLSGLRGHSLARTMYGYNYTALGVPGVNMVPFSGSGRLHYTYPAAPPTPLVLQGSDDYTLVNYTWFSGDGFLRDPERYNNPANLRVLPTTAQGNSYVGGNAPYTYPDLNNFFLAAVNAYGQVLTPSYHRAWLFQNVQVNGAWQSYQFNDMTNPNWFNLQGKYLTLRPRPAEHPQFPIPDDATGDVKNLLWTEGGNDSIWIDLGAPVMTAPDGTQYKMLFAPLIVDLDGRINLNTAGNILGAGNLHVSNQGWGPWEVNLAKVLYADQVVNPPQNPPVGPPSPPTYTTMPTEYINLITGRNLGASTIYSRYGASGTPNNPTIPGQLISPGVPTLTGNPSPAGTGPHFYAQVDYNGLNEAAPPYSSRPAPPGFGGPATSCFPTFPQGFLNGGAENINHPLLYDAIRAATYNGTDDRVFHASGMEALMRPNSLAGRAVDSGSSALLSNLLRLCPNNLGVSAANPRLRNLVTALSMDLSTPALSPNWWNGMPAASYLSVNTNGAQFAPYGQAAPFPGLPPAGGITNAAGTSPLTSEFGTDWRALSAAPITYTTNNPFTYTSPGGRIQLNRPLPPYPHMGSGLIPPYGGPVATTAIGTSYNLGNVQIANQYTAAVNARQALANDIYRRLLALAGVAAPANSAAPVATELAPRRWLAQLAVNIVDYIDEDDLNTPFNFYTTTDGLAAGNIGATQGGDDPNATGANPLYWVFGTELPKVVLNEALAEAENTTTTLTGLVPGEQVKVWVELYNTMQTPPAAPAQQQDGVAVPLYMSGNYSPYRLTVTQNLMSTLPDASANVLGKANIVAPFPVSTVDADFTPANVKTNGGAAAAASIGTQQFFLVGPKTLTANYQDPFPGAPAATSVVRTDSLSYTPTWLPNITTDERTTGLSILLRRLANPFLPYNGTPGVNYNPYVTVDYLQNVPVQSNLIPLTGNAPPLPPYSSRGKRQPYAALTQVTVTGGVPQAPSGSNALGTSPVCNQTAPNAVTTNNVTHTFGIVAGNTPLPQSGHYDWLVHLDRQAISPIELLHVSGYQPYQLTQQFILGDDSKPTNLFGHYAPWLDTPPAAIANMSTPWWYDSNLPAGSTHRLSRLFEFLECGDRAFGVNGLGRIPGKVNINTIWDAEVLQALIDANPSIGLPVVPSNRPAYIADPIAQLFNNLMQSRSPSVVYNLATGTCGGTIGPTNTASIPTGYSLDRPFLPLGTGASQVGQQYPNGVGVTTDTLLRFSPTANTQLLFQNPGAPTANPAIPADNNQVHPYLQTQLLTKLYNNVTTRSNTFAVFVTVGFFQVIPGGAVGQPNVPQLGPEIGRSEGRQVRHRMFAIVDRTNLAIGATTYAGGAITVTAAGGPQTVPLTLAATSGTNPSTGASWSLATGVSLVFEPGTDNEETVVAQPAAMGFQATFLKSHNTGVPVLLRGNPGPSSKLPYDPRSDPYVVPYFSIID